MCGLINHAPPLSHQELATGIVLGADADAALTLPVYAGDPRSALFEAVLDALSSGPCAVSFSGGYDSSLVLAVAVAAAREQGLPPPAAITVRFPGRPSTEEASWQELVIKHLGLEDWERIEVGDELDFLGEIACGALASHGLLWPANAHFHAPIFAAAAGRTVLTGFDGDGLFGAWQWARQWAVLQALQTPRPRDVLRLGFALAPRPARRSRLGRAPAWVSWLQPAALHAFARELGRERADQPRRWDRRVAWYARRREQAVGFRSFELLAESHGARVAHPLHDPRFLAAIARDGGRGGYGSRSQAIARLFGGLVPQQLFERPTKALFGEALWGPRARAFAAEWDGTGVDGELVEIAALRRAWAQPSPPLGTATLLQAAWLEAHQKRSSSASAAPGSASGSCGRTSMTIGNDASSSSAASSGWRP